MHADKHKETVSRLSFSHGEWNVILNGTRHNKTRVPALRRLPDDKLSEVRCGLPDNIMSVYIISLIPNDLQIL